MFADSSEMKDTAMPSEQELPVQRALDSVEANAVNKATDANDDPSKDSDDKIDAENMDVDEPDCTLDSVDVNTVKQANDANGHPSKDSDDRINAENMTVDEPNMIHDSSKTNYANTEQTESMVDDDVEQNDVSTNINQGLQKKNISDDVEMEKADQTTDAFGHASTDCDNGIDEGNTIIDQGRDFFIQDGVEMNDASTIIEQEIQEGSIPPIQTITPIVKQTIIQGGLAFVQELLTTIQIIMKFKCQTMKKLNMIPQIHPSNLAQNTSKKYQKASSQFLLMKILMKKKKATSLATAVSLKHLQKNNKMNLTYQKENKAKDYIQYS